VPNVYQTLSQFIDVENLSGSSPYLVINWVKIVTVVGGRGTGEMKTAGISRRDSLIVYLARVLEYYPAQRLLTVSDTCVMNSNIFCTAVRHEEKKQANKNYQIDVAWH